MRLTQYEEGGNTAKSKKQYAYNYLLNKGLTNIQAAAIAGNLEVESGFNTSAEGDKGYSGGSSRGIAQWREGRLSNLKNFAGNQWTNMDKQLDFVLHELNTSEKSAFTSLKNARTVEQATEAFTRGYERPNMSQAHLGKRIKHALELSGMAADPNFTEYGADEVIDPNTGNRVTPYQFKELYGSDWYAPKDNQSLSSLESSDESVNLAAEEQERTRRSDEIKARLDAKKAERAFMTELIGKSQVAYVNPADFQGEPQYSEPQQFQRGGTQNMTKFVDSTLNANKNLDFVKRLYDGKHGDIQIPGVSGRSTHYMASAGKRAYPTVVNIDGKLQYKEGDDAYNYADKTKEYIEFNSEEEAAKFAENGYKEGTNVLKYASGGNVIKGDRGQWDNPGEITQINSSNITMKPDPRTGKPLTQSVLGIDNLGNRQMMTPGNDYTFPGNVVTEYPQKYQSGGNLPWYQDAGMFEKTWEQVPDSVYNTLTGEATSPNEILAAAGVQQGQGIYQGDKNNPTYVSPDNILNEVVISAPKRVPGATYTREKRADILTQMDPRLEGITSRDNTEIGKVDLTRDKNFTEEALKKQLILSDKAKVAEAAKEANKLKEDRKKLLADLGKRRNDLDVIPNVFEEVVQGDLLSEGSILDAQKKLKKLGYDLNPEGKFKNDGVDGKMGAVTKAAIEEYNSKGSSKTAEYKSYKTQTGFLGKCSEGQCSEYTQNEAYRNFKPDVSREEWNEQTGLHGDAWGIGKNITDAGGSKIEINKVKPGDAVTMYTGGRSSYMGQARAAGTDATHVGMVDKVNPDGSYYIVHNVHDPNYVDFALNKIDPKHKVKYQGMEYRELIVDGKIAGGQKNSGFTVRDGYRPNYKDVKANPNTATIRKDTSLVATKNVNPDLKEAASKFVKVLNSNSNKKVITTKYGISEDDYQSLSQVTMGILEQETKYGTSIKQIPKQIAATVVKAFGDDEVSKGAGQVKFKTNFGEADITEFGITKDNFTEDKNTPLVIMSIIAPHYRRFIKSGESKSNALYKAVEKYNRGHNTDYSDNLDVDYVNKVIGYGDNFVVQGSNGDSYNTTLNTLNSDKRVISNNASRLKRSKK
jgi:hypothetical protein